MCDTKRYAGNLQFKRQIQCLLKSFLETSFPCQALKARRSFDDTPNLMYPNICWSDLLLYALSSCFEKTNLTFRLGIVLLGILSSVLM
jgi:hypothetical protein